MSSIESKHICIFQDDGNGEFILNAVFITPTIACRLKLCFYCFIKTVRVGQKKQDLFFGQITWV